MAVKLLTARNTFLAAVREFPKWMSIRKRPEKATSGLFLQAIIEEQTDIVEELEKFIKEFFLISYVGKESTIADYVYIVQVGDIDYLTSELIKPVLDITIDTRTFLNNMDTFALYQGGYLIIGTNNLPSDGSLLYTYNDYKYGGKLQRYHIWNIFDEFAMFLGLNRFSDTGETNAQLLKRCFLVFSNPTNSTRTGLQNVIMNCLSNDITVEREDIKVEIPDNHNVWLPYGNDTVYEHFVQLNKDIFRTKVWDSTWWEHNFKQLDYLSHVWDKTLDVYQDGTGQLLDLKASLSQSSDDSTAVTVRGFKRDVLRVNEYFRKNNIRVNISLDLLKYHDVLSPKHVQYMITATTALQINPQEIMLREQIRTEGIHKLYLQDIISPTGDISILNPGTLIKGKTYELILKSRDNYSDMRINKLDFVDNGITKNLISETRTFKLVGKSLVHADVKHHISRTADLKSYTNFVDVLDGFALSKANKEGTFTLDITGCGGKTLKISSYGDMFDLTEQTDRWICNGLQLKDYKLVSETVIADKGTATLDITCMGFSVNLLRTATAQGAVDVKVYVNDILNSTLSKLMTDPDIPMECWFDTLSNVKIIFTKSGSYPFAVEVKGTKYEITYSTSVGSVIQGPVSNYISDIPDTTPNTLTVTVKAYDIKTPVIRYVHIGPSTARASYTVKDIKPTSDNAYLDIDTTCQVFLYEIVDGQRQLISDDFITKRIYRNGTGEDIYQEVNLEQFSEILSSSLKINKTVRYGKTITYVTLKPGDEVSSLTVTGVIHYGRALRTIRELLNLDINYNVYVAGNADGFIVRDPSTNEEWLARINRNLLTEATVFSYENLPTGISGVFVLDRPNNNRLFSSSANRNFDDTFLTVTDAQKYIAYNEIDMYKPTIGEVENIDIITSMFYPQLPSNAMMFYQISTIENTDGFSATAVFKKQFKGKVNYFGITHDCRQALEDILLLIEKDKLRDVIETSLSSVNSKYDLQLSYSNNLYDDIKHLISQGSWSLGKKEIFLSTGFDFNNSDVFSINTNTINSAFSLSNEIKLSRNFDVDGETLDLCVYVIKPAGGMKVVFDEEDDIIENGLIVKEDGFNKLKYSNIKNIDSLVVDGIGSSDYTLLEDEGIIVWNNVSSIAGSYFSVAYTYKVPTGLAYTNLSSLYEKAGYDVNAFLPVNLVTKLDDEYYDGDNFAVEWEETVDYVPSPVCSNPNFIATYNNDIVTVKQLYNDNVILLNAGYYYDDDKEYYYYNHEYARVVQRYSNVELHNVKKLDVIFQFMMETVNYVIHSNFKSGINYEKLCYVKFNDSFIESKGMSLFNEITACETYNLWRSYNMGIEFAPGLKGTGLLFTSEDSTGYAVMNVTKYVIPKMLISVFTTSGISLEIYKEIKADGDIMAKTVFAEPFAAFSTNDDFQGYLVPEDIDLTCQYFLVVKGSGIVDDMISRQNVPLEDQLQLHTKNIEDFGFIVSERETTGSLLYLAFEKDGCNLDHLEISKDNTIQIGTNVDYGVTQVFDSRDDYDSFMTTETVIRKKGTFITTDKQGWIRTPFFYLENNNNVIDLYVKVNNLITGAAKNFNVKLRSSDNEEDANFRDLGYVQKTNLAHFAGSQLGTYIQAEIEMDSNKLVDSVEIFVRYGEKETSPLIIQSHLSGSVTTKVYDTVTESSYKFNRIVGKFNDQDHIKIFMRGCRQDSLYMVWTSWYEISFDNNLEVIGSSHIFDNYRLFQFKIEFLSSSATALIENFVLEVV